MRFPRYIIEICSVSRACPFPVWTLLIGEDQNLKWSVRSTAPADFFV